MNTSARYTKRPVTIEAVQLAGGTDDFHDAYLWVESHVGTTTIKVKRACSNCHRILGDATQEEMEVADDGRPLPDTAEECGCASHPAIKETQWSSI